MKAPTRTTFITAAALTLTAAGLLFAGPLNPPAGPVTSTYKTLTEVEPRIAINLTNTPGDADSLFKITQRGSYYLTGNITVPASVFWGISIEASGVTLDLNGFTIDGNAHEVGGIVVSQSGVTIRNGTITRTTASGISTNLFPIGSAGLTIENIRVLTVFGSGIPSGGSAGVGTAGIFAGRGAIIRNCYVSDAALGIAAGYNSNISGCTVEFARQHAFHLQGGATISDCVAVGTGGLTTESTYFLGAGSTAVNCIARSNSGAGFATEDECSLQGCSATNNSGHGISTRDGCTVSNCTAVKNLGSGISVGSGCTVADSIARRNSLDGIVCASACLIRGNTSSNNGFDASGAGIHATGPDNRIESNNCTYSTRGIDVDAVRNMIMKNTCSLNTTNWDIVAGNVCLVVQGSTGGAILGNTGGVATGSTDPNANFSY